MLNAQSLHDVYDDRLYIKSIPLNMNEDVMTRIFKNHNPTKIFRAPPPRNYAIITFGSNMDAKKAMMDVANQPPFNLKITFAKKTHIQEKKYGNNYTKENGNSFGKSKKSFESQKHRSDGSDEAFSDAGSSNRGSQSKNSNSSKFHKRIPKVGECLYNRDVDNLSTDSKLTVGNQESENLQGVISDALKLLANDSEIQNTFSKDIKFSKALGNLITMLIEDIKNPSPNAISILKKLSSLKKEQFIPVPEIKEVQRLTVAEFSKAGDKMTLSIVKTEEKSSVCITLLESFQLKYTSLCDEFSAVCEKQGVVAGGAVGLVAIRLTSDGQWYRAVERALSWALPDDGRSVPLTEADRVVACPLPYAEIPFFCCVLTYKIKILKEDIPFSVNILSINKENRSLEVNLSNLEYGIHFNGTLKPWIPFIAQTATVETKRSSQLTKPMAQQTVPPQQTMQLPQQTMRSPQQTTQSPQQKMLSPQQKMQSPYQTKQTPQLIDVSIASPKTLTNASINRSEIAPQQMRKSIAETCKVNDELKLSVVMAENKGLICLILSNDSGPQYESLCDEFGAVCEKQGAVADGSAGLVAIRLTSDGQWYRAVKRAQGWALPDDGRSVPLTEADRVVTCPLPYANIPFFCSFLLPEICGFNDTIPYSVKINSIDESSRTLSVTVANIEAGVCFSGKLQPWIPSTVNSQLSPNPTAPKPAVNEMTTKNEVVSMTKTRLFAAESCNVNDELKMSVVMAEGKGSICLTLSNDMAGQYESLCDEFGAVCEKQAASADGAAGLMAIRLTSDGQWYRAVGRAQGWALPDDGRSVPLTEADRVVICPLPYADIVFFCCLLTHNMQGFNDTIPYSVKIISKDVTSRTLSVTVSNEEAGVSFDGKLQPWIPSTADKRPPSSCNSIEKACTPDTPKASSKVIPSTRTSESSPSNRNSTNASCKTISNGSLQNGHGGTDGDINTINKLFMAEICTIGDEMKLHIGVNGVCLTVCEKNRSDYERLCKEFANVCGQICSNNKSKVNPCSGLVAARLGSDGMWYRAVMAPTGDWSLVDDGRTVAAREVKTTIVCPTPYADIPFFCCKIQCDFSKLKESNAYKFKVLSKNNEARKLNINIDVDGQCIAGSMVPWIPCITIAPSPPPSAFENLNTSTESTEERCSKNPIFFNDMPKYVISPGSLLIMVKFIDFSKVYVRLADEENSNNYLLHLDNLASVGYEARPLNRAPIVNEILLCKKEEQYYRAKVIQYEPSNSKCCLFILDLCAMVQADVSSLRPSPTWVGKVPPPLSIFLTHLTSTRYNDSSLQYIKTLMQRKVPLKCKSFDSNGAVLMVDQTLQDMNKMLVDLSIPQWKKLQQPGMSILNLPALMVNNLKYQPLLQKQPVKITDSSTLIVGFVSCTNENELINKKLKYLREQIEEYCDNTPEPYMPRLDELCIYKDDDGTWQRGYVMDIANDCMEVRSLDLGRMTSNVNFSRIRKMLSEFMTPLPALAPLCSVEDFPKNPSSKALEKAEKFLKANSIFIPKTLEETDENLYKIGIPDLINCLRKENLI